MDDADNESLNHGLTGTDEQFHSQDPMADVNNVESSFPSPTEMLAVISESRELAQDLQNLLLSSPCTSQNSHNPMASTENSTETKAKEELFEFDFVDSTSPSDTCPRTTTAATITNLTCFDKNFQPHNIKLVHQESLKFNVEVKNCENVVVGDYAKADICFCQKEGTVNQTASFTSTGCHRNENCSLVRADGDKNPTGLSKRKTKKRSPSEKTSGKRSATKTNSEPGKIKTKWRLPLNLSDFTDTESLQNSIDQWLKVVISDLLSKAQDLDDCESLIKLLEEARNLYESSIPNCIHKLAEAIQAMMEAALVEFEDGGKYSVLLIETQFALAEFYTKEGEYLTALDCLRTIEKSLSGDTQKSRLYAKIGKVMEHRLEYSVDFPADQKEHEGGFNSSVSNRHPDEVVLSCYEKALKFSNEEPSVEKREIIQRCCYLGKAAVQMRLWERQTETERNLPEVRQNLSSTERLFNSISPAMRCQFYLAESFLHFFEGGHQMLAKMKIQKAKKIAEEEHFLERKCLGSKRLYFLLEELNKVTDISKVGGEILDLNSVESQL